MKLNKIKILVFIFFSWMSLSAQNDVKVISYPAYKEALQVINPAQVGVTGKTDVALMIESQMSSLKDNRQYLSLAIPLPKKLSVGLSVVNDSHHISKKTDVYADFSYNLTIDENHKVFFGLKGGGAFINKDFQALNKTDDPEFSESVKGQFSPNFGVGVYLEGANYFVSVSIPKALDSKFENVQTDNMSVIERPNIFINSGYTFDFNNSSQMKLTPSVLVQHTTVINDLALELGANLEFMKQFEIGVANRFNHSFTALAAFKFMERYKVGFAYKNQTQGLSLSSYGIIMKAQF